MLPISINDNASYAVLTDTRRGFHLLLARKATVASAQPFEAVWALSCGDLATLNAAAHWFAVRRIHWQQWGDHVLTHGIESFSLVIKNLMDKEPVGPVVACFVRGLDDDTSLVVGEIVALQDNTRRDTLYEHRFATAGKRNRFLKWFGHNASNGSVERLVQLGIREGTGKLGKALDAIAAGREPAEVRRSAA